MPTRPRLNRDAVLRTAIALADDIGLEALSMRRLAQQLEVVPMALYKHVANKEQLLDGMVDVTIGEIPRATDADWRTATRQQILSARATLQAHPWSRRAVETRTGKSPAVLDYIEHLTGLLLAGGLSADLTHHAMHALGGRMWGFTQEVFEDVEAAAPPPPEALAYFAQRYPSILAVAAPHGDSVVGGGCDDEFEFSFALDLMLDGFERLRSQGWRSR